MVPRNAFPSSALFLLVEASLAAVSIWLPYYLLVDLAPRIQAQMADLPLLIFVHAFPYLAVLSFFLTAVRGLVKLWWWRGSIADLEPVRGGSIVFGRHPDWVADMAPFWWTLMGAALLISALVSAASSNPVDYLVGVVWFTAPIWLLFPLFAGVGFLLRQMRILLALPVT